MPTGNSYLSRSACGLRTIWPGPDRCDRYHMD